MSSTRPLVPALALALLTVAAMRADESAAGAAGFLAEAAPLLTEEELAIYRSLDRPYRRAAFERRFWETRDPFPETPANELADRWRERLPEARQRFASLDDDRAWIFLLAGEPGSRRPFRCGEQGPAGEVWRYAGAERIPERFTLVFVEASGGEPGRHRLWRPAEGAGGLTGGEPTAAACAGGDELAAALPSASDWDELDRKHRIVPRPGADWARAFLPLAAPGAAGGRPAASLQAELELAFPGRRQQRTRVEGTLRVTSEGSAARAFALDGEIVRGDVLIESFRYRFEPLSSALDPSGRTLLSFERVLRAGSYDLVLRLTDLETGAALDFERAVDVPAPSESPAPADAELAEAGDEDEGATAVRLFAPLDRLVTGKLRVEAEVRGAGVARVAFSLDGRRVLEKSSAPWAVELDLGSAPRPRRLAAVALDALGRTLAGDELVLNGGPHRFAVRLLEPSRIRAGADRIAARAAVEVPEGETVERLELYLDDALAVTLYQPPWAQTLRLAPGATAVWVRAVAHLAGGGAAEDVRLLAGGALGESVDVDLVELYTAVVDRRGRPVEELDAALVAVREDGERQAIRRLERVRDRPVHAGLLLDVSGSMVEELPDLERAALTFFERVLTPRDRAAVITFSDRVRLAAKFTSRTEILAGALAGIEARGDTHLYDAVAHALHYFSGVRGQRALVLVSDGVDSGSRHRFADVLDYARRTGVAIYAIGLGVPSRPPDARLVLEQLTRETGGRLFTVNRTSELRGVYAAIEAEIRSQWLITYQSPRSSGGAFREVSVEVSRPGVVARTIRGYYP